MSRSRSCWRADEVALARDRTQDLWGSDQDDDSHTYSRIDHLGCRSHRRSGVHPVNLATHQRPSCGSLPQPDGQPPSVPPPRPLGSPPASVHCHSAQPHYSESDLTPTTAAAPMLRSRSCWHADELALAQDRTQDLWGPDPDDDSHIYSRINHPGRRSHHL